MTTHLQIHHTFFAVCSCKQTEQGTGVDTHHCILTKVISLCRNIRQSTHCWCVINETNLRQTWRACAFILKNLCDSAPINREFATSAINNLSEDHHNQQHLPQQKWPAIYVTHTFYDNYQNQITLSCRKKTFCSMVLCVQFCIEEYYIPSSSEICCQIEDM